MEDGSFEAGEPINTPGVPIHFRGNQLLSAEPSYDEEGGYVSTIHHSRLENGGAFIVESRELSGHYQAARRSGEMAYVLMTSKQECADPPTSTLLPVQLDDAGPTYFDPTELSGDFYYSENETGFEGDLLRVEGGPIPGARALIDVSDPDALAVERYTTHLP